MMTSRDGKVDTHGPLWACHRQDNRSRAQSDLGTPRLGRLGWLTVALSDRPLTAR